MNRSQVDQFEKMVAQVTALHTEIGALAKKSPNDAVNQFKLKFINQVLQSANTLISHNYKPFTDFEQFDIDAVPTNSDVTFMLAQYMNCLEKMRSDNITQGRALKWFWLIDGEISDIPTHSPSKLG